jgi:hypothetical protein
VCSVWSSRGLLVRSRKTWFLPWHTTNRGAAAHVEDATCNSIVHPEDFELPGEHAIIISLHSVADSLITNYDSHESNYA